MPLLDHFHPPLSVYRHWEGFHSAWANAIVQQLNRGLLPPRYYAEPHIHLGIQVEADVATFEKEGRADGAGGGVATAVWAPARPTVRAPLAFARPDLFEVQVINDEEGPRLVAAIELISPANKDRPGNRQAFAVKCASYLQQGIAVVIVDVVTTRQSDLHTELLQLLDLSSALPEAAFPPLYAVAYRTAGSAGQLFLEAWPETLNLGAVLPTLPLWLGADLVLPLNLDQSYAATCESLRIQE
jgi:hypothetical protein